MTSQPEYEREPLAPSVTSRMRILELAIDSGRVVMTAEHDWLARSFADGGHVLSVKFSPDRGWDFRPGDYVEVTVTPYRDPVQEAIDNA